MTIGSSTPESSSAPADVGRGGGLRRRIAFGFALVLLMHLTVVALSHLVLARSAESSERTTETHAAVTGLLAMDRDVERLQGDVLSFMYTGDVSLAARVTARADRLLGNLKQHAKAQVDAGAATDVARMIVAVQAYQEGLNSVIAQRGRREQILIESVRPYAAKTRNGLTELLLEAEGVGTTDLIVQVGRALEWFAKAEDYVLSYQLDPSGDALRGFRSASDAFRSAVETIDASRFADGGQAGLEEIRAGLADWNRAVFQVVSSTRSFLHLVDVVLAGQALEFRTLSSRLVDGALAAQRAAEAEISAGEKRIRFLSDWVGILTVVAGIIAGWWISRSVSEPITAMTETFSALAAGEDTRIAGLGRKDEIGRLASAAQVFAKRNLEGQALLTQADAMARRQEATNRELEDRVTELKLRNEDLDSFSYSASHDLRAPLRSIALLAEWIQDDAADVLPEESSEHLKTLLGRVGRLDKLLDGLLAYARIGRTENLKELVSVREVVDEAVEALTAGTNARLTIEGESVHVMAARVALHKTVQNLVSNAIAHHDKEEPHVTVSIGKQGGYARIVVEDDGPGIPAFLQEKVFQIFQTVKPRDDHEASGIGLAIVQKLVYTAGGTIELESDGERGSKFIVLWPGLTA